MNNNDQESLPIHAKLHFFSFMKFCTRIIIQSNIIQLVPKSQEWFTAQSQTLCFQVTIHHHRHRFGVRAPAGQPSTIQTHMSCHGSASSANWPTQPAHSHKFRESGNLHQIHSINLTRQFKSQNNKLLEIHFMSKHTHNQIHVRGSERCWWPLQGDHFFTGELVFSVRFSSGWITTRNSRYILNETS